MDAAETQPGTASAVNTQQIMRKPPVWIRVRRKLMRMELKKSANYVGQSAKLVMGMLLTAPPVSRFRDWRSTLKRSWVLVNNHVIRKIIILTDLEFAANAMKVVGNAPEQIKISA